MNLLRRGFPVAFLLLCLFALCSGCSGGQEHLSGKRFLIGVSQANLSEPWRVAMNAEIRQASRYHADLTVISTDAGDSSERQIEDVRRLMEYGVDLLIISPTDAKALTPVIRELHVYIPVIVLDRDIEGYDYTLFIGPDNERLGREAGLVALDLLGEGGTVLEIQGRRGSPPAVSRTRGFTSVLRDSGRARILPPVSGDWLRDSAEDEMEKRLADLPRVDVVFAHNDAMAYGAYLAAKRHGLERSIRFIGIDGLSGPLGGIDLVTKGILEATFTCPTGGKEAIDYAIDILSKSEGIPKKVLLRPRRLRPGSAPDSESPREISPVASTGDRPITLGFAQIGSESAWRVANTQSIQQAAKDAGINLIFVDGEQSQEKQVAAIRRFIAEKVDMIAFPPVVETGWEEVLGEAKAAGIPVILTDRSLILKDDSLWLTFVGSDFREEGRRAARWLASELADRGSAGILELRGTEGSAPAIERKAGFEEVLGEYPFLKIVASEPGDFTRASGRETMRAILRRGPLRFSAVFAHNDDMALGAIEALEDAGFHPGRDISIVSIDGVREAFQSMRARKLSCTVECNPLLGPLLMKAVKDYMAGKDLPRRIITAEDVYSRETVERDSRVRRY